MPAAAAEGCDGAPPPILSSRISRTAPSVEAHPVAAPRPRQSFRGERVSHFHWQRGQDRIARWLLDELRDDENWARQFASSQDALSKLAAEARVERSAGRATELDPDKL